MSTPSATIAVVEDDDAMRKSITRLLGAQGYATEAFADAEAFLDSGATARIAGIVLDIRLPGMSGLELQRQLRASGSNAPVMFITARGSVAAVCRPVKRGNDPAPKDSRRHAKHTVP